MPTPTKQLTIDLPTPHGKQRDIITSPAKRKVICTGRRFGKTLSGALIAVDDEIGGGIMGAKKVLIASTSQDQSDVFWGYLRRWLAPLVQAGAAYKNETKRIIELANGGAVRVKTGRDPDVLRGFDADTLILDECAFLDPLAWYEVGAPMMADRNGTAVFYSTPKRKNWFYLLYSKALADTSGRWQAWHGTTLDNPYLSQIAVNELASDMTEEGYKQEILAQFLEGSGQVFRNLQECAIAPIPEKPYEGRFIMGVDTAQQNDYTALIILDAATRKQVAIDHFNRVTWQVYRDRIRALYELWQPEQIIFEINSVGSPNYEALAADGLPVVAFETTALTKAPLIESLVLAFERREISIFDHAGLLSELGAYERKVSVTGRSQYSAPEGLHDDYVMALALAWHGVNTGVYIPRVTAIDW